MTDARRFMLAALVTATMPLFVIGLPLTLSAAHVGGTDHATHHVYGGAR